MILDKPKIDKYAAASNRLRHTNTHRDIIKKIKCAQGTAHIETDPNIPESDVRGCIEWHVGGWIPCVSITRYFTHVDLCCGNVRIVLTHTPMQLFRHIFSSLFSCWPFLVRKVSKQKFIGFEMLDMEMARGLHHFELCDFIFVQFFFVRSTNKWCFASMRFHRIYDVPGQFLFSSVSLHFRFNRKRVQMVRMIRSIKWRWRWKSD